MIYTVITITIPIIIISMITKVSGIMFINLTRSVERALNQRRRALKLLQKETKRHSGAKVLLQICIFLISTVKQRSQRNQYLTMKLFSNVISTFLRTMTLTSWIRQRQTLTRKARHSGWRNLEKLEKEKLFRRELAHFDTVMREEFSKTFDRFI